MGVWLQSEFLVSVLLPCNLQDLDQARVRDMSQISDTKLQIISAQLCMDRMYTMTLFRICMLRVA